MANSYYSKIFQAGEVIFKEGEPGDCAYLIDKGRVRILVEQDGENKEIATLTTGDIFGEMSIIDSSNRSATAVSLDMCEVMVVSKEQISERVQESDPIVRFLIAVLLTRLRSSLKFETKAKKFPSTNVIPLQAHRLTRSQKTDLADVIDKFKLEKDLHQALEQSQLFMHYQPIIDFKTGIIAGFEALIRWQCPERGMVRPDVFIGVAEETSLIIPIGQWIVQQTCQDYAFLKNELKKAGKLKDPLFLSINIAGKQLKDPELLKVLKQSVKKHKLRPEELKLEITERILIQGERAFEWVRKCRELGYSIALDDFGTGYSSLRYLDELEVNNIKIDKSFTQKMIKDKKTKAIVKSLIDLAEILEMDVTAEGVETMEEHQMLKDFGCTYMQGYLFSKPLSIDDVLDLILRPSKKIAA